MVIFWLIINDDLITVFCKCSLLTTLLYVIDPKPAVQEQALALVRNLVDGPIDSIEYVFAEDGLLLHAVGRQLRSASKSEVLIQVRSLLNENWELECVGAY